MDNFNINFILIGQYVYQRINHKINREKTHSTQTQLHNMCIQKKWLINSSIFNHNSIILLYYIQYKLYYTKINCIPHSFPTLSFFHFNLSFLPFRFILILLFLSFLSFLFSFLSEVFLV